MRLVYRAVTLDSPPVVRWQKENPTTVILIDPFDIGEAALDVSDISWKIKKTLQEITTTLPSNLTSNPADRVRPIEQFQKLKTTGERGLFFFFLKKAWESDGARASKQRAKDNNFLK